MILYTNVSLFVPHRKIMTHISTSRSMKNLEGLVIILDGKTSRLVEFTMSLGRTIWFIFSPNRSRQDEIESVKTVGFAKAIRLQTLSTGATES